MIEFDNHQVYQSLYCLLEQVEYLGKGKEMEYKKYITISPEVETDFAIANLAEETGFVGMFIALFLILYLHLF